MADAGCAGTTASQAGDAGIVAQVGDRKIDLAEVDRKALTIDAGRFNGLRLQQALYEARLETIEQIINDHLIESEAKARGLSSAALIEQEVTSKLAPVQDAEIVTWYEQNPDRVRDTPLDNVRQPIRELLAAQRRQIALDRLVTGLRGKTAVRMSLPPPRQDITTGPDNPGKGPADAPVQIVEFSDFECPFCGQVTPTVRRIADTYGDRVRIVYLDLPLPIHPNAVRAAEAAQCAFAQDKFWDYHDRLFANQKALQPEHLKQYAVDLGLDTAKFNACLDQGSTSESVKRDMREAEAAGVSSTPYFFINGRVVSGARPFEVFKQLIDEELELKGAAATR
jgi:protein-disulfide isomerase